MKTQASNHENISALLDSELTGAELDLALSQLIASSDKAAQAEDLQTWALYHQIGDVLRSDELAVTFSEDFSSRFSAMLDQEPVILAPRNLHNAAPVIKPDLPANLPSAAMAPRRSRAWAWAGMAAAAIIVSVIAPQFPHFSGTDSESNQIASVNATIRAADGGAQLVSAGDIEPAPQVQQSLEMLRDPRLDSYLMAHQRFSPSISGSNVYVTHTSNPIDSLPPAVSEDR